METMTEAVRRLRHGGFAGDATAAPGGVLRCGTCGAECDPTTAAVDEIVRFEWATDPGDAAILVALHCRCGHATLFASAYGADVTPEQAQVLGRLPARIAT